MGKGTYLSNKLLDAVLGITTYTPPATIDFALYTSAPSAGGGGTEVSGGSYARQSQANNSTNWPAASGGSKTNATTITFPTATANWGTVVAAAMFEGGTNNLMWFGNLTASRLVNSGDSVRFAGGSGVTVQES